MNERQQPTSPDVDKTELLKTLWVLLKSKPVIGPIVILVLVIVFIIAGLSVDILKDWLKERVFKIYVEQIATGTIFLVSAIIGLVAGSLLAYVFRSYFSEFPTTARRIEAHLNEWVGRADGVMREAARAALKEMSLTFPWEYINFIEIVDKEYEEEKRERHIESITLYGTMVGFAFLLPEAIRNHACRAKRDFRMIEVLASDAVISVDKQDKHLVLYPLWLVVSVVHELLLGCKDFLPKVLRDSALPHSLTIQVVYFPHDLMAAAIHLPHRRILICQALDHKGLERVLEAGQLQVGFSYSNKDAVDAYDRYEAAIKNQVSIVKRKIEKWVICANKDGDATLTITNPHWVRNADGTISIVQTATDYDDAPKITMPTLIGSDEIRGFLEALKNGIGGSESAGRDIIGTDPKAKAAKDLWTQRYRLQCPCGGAGTSLPKPITPSFVAVIAPPSSGGTSA